MRRSGLTLVEVLVAVAVLAVGVLGAAALQANALRATRTARIVQELDADALSAVNLLRVRYADAEVVAAGRHDCGPGFQNDCSFEVQPCELLAGQLQCSSSTLSRPDAIALLVTVSSRDSDHEVQLNTIVRTVTR